MSSRIRRAATTLAVALLALTTAAASARAEAPSCPVGAPATWTQESVGGPGNAVYGGFYLGDAFVASGSSITRMAVWMKQAADAPVTLSVIEGTAIGGTVVGTATIAAGVSGKAVATPSSPIAVRAGGDYILKVNAPGATRGLAELIPATASRFVYARDGGRGGGDWRPTNWDMAMEVDFCGSAGVGSCTLGAPATVLQESVGGPGNAIYGGFYLGDSFVAAGSSIERASVWIAAAADAPVTVSVIEGAAIGGTVLGTATIAAGVTGKAEVTFPRAIAVRAGNTYILKLNAPAATRGTAELVPAPSGYVYVRDGGGGGGDRRATGWEMALEVGFCGATVTRDTQPPTSGDFGPVHGPDVAAQGFSALDGTLYDASIWLTEANDGPLSLTVRNGSPSGAVVASAELAAGPAGKRSVRFEDGAAVRSGSTYVLVVGTGAVETGAGRVARRADDATQQAWDASGPVSRDMAIELSFGPSVGRVGDLVRAQCVARLSFPGGYVASVETALRSKPDVWGEALLSAPGGPTYDNIKDHLLPLRGVGSPAGTAGNRLTDSGVFYIPMWAPQADTFAQSGALHVADGSQIASRRADGRRMTTFVGVDGRERYGLCEAALEEPALADGHLPVLQVSYRDIDGVAYTQESFVAWLPGTRTPASFVKLTAQRGTSSLSAVDLRVVTGDSALSDAGGSITSDGNVVVYDGAGWTLEHGTTLRSTVDISSGAVQTRYLVRPVAPAAPSTFTADAASYAAALSQVRTEWNAKLATGATYQVPEQRVMDAQRNLLIQALQLNWRYSYGNLYETYFQPESSSALQRLAEYGFPAAARDGLQALLPLSKGATRYPNWERGEKLSHAAAYWFLTGDTAFIRANTPTYASLMDTMASQLAADPNGILPREGASGDITASLYGTHAQAVGWRGMRDMALVWRLIGESALAARYEPIAESFRRSLRAAIDSSKRSVGSATFVPHDLLGGHVAFDPITATRIGSYWNLLHPYVLASGIFAPGSAEADDIWRYSREQGALMLGLQRFNYYPTAIGSVFPNGLPGYKTTGDDNVYMIERVRFLAANDKADKIVLALYGKLAHGMTRKTFVGGEGHTIGPVLGEYFRSMYLPPTSSNADGFLVALREALVHVGERADGIPDRLWLAFSTPRAWTEEGKTIAVDDAPTPFGAVSYRVVSSIASARRLDVTATLPASASLRELKLRLRLPAGRAVTAVRETVTGRIVPFSGETLDLSGFTGAVSLRVEVR
ncbi:hypothetical protein [Conexibacter arvalis]|uniref:Uncharacterized protein n=1 Tax=Conexibacter arvalis TaxID=912552 RepID=A0A840IIR7_9ACTN|nr:hypothetical protein [Conexibacter arvalis]MBB4664073.1 hypothetical protein [Conexibacter arvalis]